MPPTMNFPHSFASNYTIPFPLFQTPILPPRSHRRADENSRSHAPHFSTPFFIRFSPSLVLEIRILLIRVCFHRKVSCGGFRNSCFGFFCLFALACGIIFTRVEMVPHAAAICTLNAYKNEGAKKCRTR